MLAQPACRGRMGPAKRAVIGTRPCATLRRSFKPGTARPERSDGADPDPHAPDASRHRAAGVRFVSGAPGPRGRHGPSRPLRGAPVAAEGDLIFTTAATGWGEILTDPSYAGQIVVLTHPMAGNYRIDPTELESDRVHARALIVHAARHAAGGSGAVAGGAAGRGRHPGARGRRHPGADAGAAPRRRATRRHPPVPARRMTSSEDEARAVQEASAARPGRRSTMSPRSRRVDARRARRRPATRAGRCSSTTASSARCCARSPRAAWRSRCCRTTRRAADVAAHAPGPGRPLAGPRRSVAHGTRRSPPCAALAAAAPWRAARRSWASAWATSSWRSPPARRRGAWRSAITAATTRCIELASGRVDIGAHNHEVEVLDGPALAAAGYRVSHRDLNDGTVEGLRARSRAGSHRSSSTRRVRPDRSTRHASSTWRRLRMPRA